MSIKEKIQKELESLKSWSQDANIQARLAASGANSELRKVWMETEQNIAKLEAKLSNLGEGAEKELEGMLSTVKNGWEKLKNSRE